MGNDFNNALGNFISDFASGGAVRHLCDLGFTVDEIADKLDYPLPKEKIAKIVFQYYLDTGIVCLNQPINTVEKAHFIREQSSLGKNSLRKVVETVNIDSDEYLKCDFGRQLYRDKSIGEYADISKRLKKHIESLPWPLQEVWVRKDFFNPKN